MANNNTLMNAMDSVYGSLAQCFVTINGRRMEFMHMTEFESKWGINIRDVPILGKVGFGHKPAGGKGTFTGKAHYNNSTLRVVADNYQKTGIFPPFEIQVVNEDPGASVGRQTVVHHDCISDSITLAKFVAGEDLLDEDISGTFDSWDLPERFRDLPGM